MQDTFTIKQPEGSIIFFSMQEYAEYCKERRFNDSIEIDGEPDSYPCIGFPVKMEYEPDRYDRLIFAFVYLHMDEDEKRALFAKSEWEPLDRFESALLMS